MDRQASSSKAYRNPIVSDGSDDEDLDDLDDVLAGFNQPKPSAPVSAPPRASATTSTVTVSSSSAAPQAGGAEDDDGDFEASLAGEMEQLLRQLAGTHIPGPMPDVDGADPDDPPAAGAGASAGLPKGLGGAGKMSAEEEEAAFQKAIEMMLSGEGLEALGLDGKGAGSAGGASGSGSASRAAAGGAAPGQPKPTFDETIRRTMEQLGSKDTRGAAGGDGEMPDLAALLAKLGQEGGLGDGDEDDLGGLLDGMMSSLMTKEVLEEPMSELASKYPAYLASPPAGVSAEDMEKYRRQSKLVDQIVATFRKPGYSADEDGQEIARLVGEMQDLGGPPKEIIGDLPEGLDFGGMGGDEACTIM